MSRRATLAAVALALGLGAAGCGKDDGGGATTATVTQAAPPAEAPAGAPVPPPGPGDLSAEQREAFAAFGACLREQGVDLPAPGAPGSGPQSFGLGDGDVQAAMEACRDELPAGLAPAPGDVMVPQGG
ncbi:MAG TPA: hypothetical protein VIL49_18360 [Capillimicrobium sp.]|jgi:pyruvate/2-oxoglutarate dehydrogenase complex dihydrolipoamide acyltransferase (E2) component